MDEPEGSAAGLSRRIGLATAASMVVGEVIGVGIFLTPAEMARSLGASGWLVLVWLIMGVSAIGGALTLGGLASRYPEAGGPYVFLREAFGPRVGFLYGWLSMLVTDPGLTAFLGVGLATYAAHLMPLSGWGVKGIAVAAIALMAGLNIMSAGIGSGVMRGLAGLKIGLLVFLATWGFASGRGDWSNLSPVWMQRTDALPLPQALAIGAIGAFVALAGWWDASRLAGEVRDPERNMPRALCIGIAIVTALYVVVSVAFLYLVDPAQLTSNENEEAIAALAGRALFGRAGELAIAGVVIVSVAGSLAAVLLAFPRVYYAMARDGLFFPSFAAVDPTRGTPARAVALQAGLASLLAMSGTFDQILGFFMVPTLAFLALAIASVFRLRRRPGGSAIVIPGYPVAPLLFLVPVVLVIVRQSARDWKSAAIGLAIVAVGVPVSGVVTRVRSRGGDQSIDSV